MAANSPVTGALQARSKELTGNALQATLADLVDLSLIADQAHWTVLGANFRSVHLQLDELLAMARGYVDSVAERASAIGVPPNGKAITVVETSGLSAFPEDWQSVESTVAAIVTVLGELIGRLRQRIEDTDYRDPVTQDLLIAITAQIEKQHWMWQAQQA